MSRRRILPWAWGFLAAAVMCCSYPMMFTYRKVWQSHYPELARGWSSDGRFTVLGLFGTETSFEEMIYAARMEEAAWRVLPFDPFIKENRSRRILWTDHLTYRFLGLLQRAVGDPSWTWILARLLCGCLWTVLTYHIVLRLTSSEPLALFSGVFLTCFGYLITFLFLSQLSWSGGFVRSLLHDAWVLLSYGRTESVCRLPRPGLSYAALFAAALLNAGAAESRGRLWPVLSGLWGGLLLYIRADVGTTYLAATFLFAAVYSWKNRPSWGLWLSASVSLLVAIPWFLVTYPLNPEFISRLCKAHAPPDPLALIYALAAVVLVYAKKEPMSLFVAALLAAVGLILNLHLVTGCSVSPFNWRCIGNIFLFLGALSFAPASLKDRVGLWRGAAAAALVVAFLQGAGFAAIHFPFYGLRQDDEAALGWLNKNTETDSVVAALGPEANGLIPVFTHNKVALSFALPLVSDIPLAENARRLAGVLRIFDAPAEKFLRECFKSQNIPDRRVIDQADRTVEAEFIPAAYFSLYPLARVTALVWNDRGNLLLPQPDYVWFGPFERRFAGRGFPVKSPWRLREVYRNPSVVIYKNLGA